MLSVEEARSKVLDAFAPLEGVSKPLQDAFGDVLVDDVVAPHSLPRFDNSAMDGYAVVSSDVADASNERPVTLELVGEVRAGDAGETEISAGQASRIMTGAPLPPGADAIAQVEITEESDERVVIRAPITNGLHVRRAGSDIESGALVAGSGTEIGPGEIALLASLGVTPVSVHRRPSVAVISTGDELVGIDEEPSAGQIRDSNTLALETLIRQAGGEPVAFSRVADTREAVLDAFAEAAQRCDLLVSSGGVSVGRYDFVKEAVETYGRIDMWRVAMQPGKPVVLGEVKDTPFLGLPGNPVSIHIGFEQFVRPAIRRMRGCRTLLRPEITARLTDEITKNPGRLHFVRVRLSPTADGWAATPTGSQGSHIQSSLVECDGVARFAPEAERIEADAPVTVEVWRLPQR